jgi:arylsulfatase A-like enzyme
MWPAGVGRAVAEAIIYPDGRRPLWHTFPRGAWQVSEVVYGEARIVLRSRRWKLAIDARGLGYMLYDLQRDPDEQHNLAADHGSNDVKGALRRALASTLAELRYGAGVFPRLD